MSEAIWIFAEIDGRRIAPVTGQLITKARAIAEGRPVEVVLFETPEEHFETELTEFKPDRIYCLKDARFHNVSDEALAAALAEAVRQHQPNSLLLGATPLGRSVAARAQAILQTGLTADCLDLYFDSDLLVQVKPSYGDNVMCEIVCPDKRPQMATIRENTFEAMTYTDTDVPVEELHLTIPETNSAQVLDNSLKIATNTGVAGANKVLALGRGANDDTLVAEARVIAERIGASVGVSRPLTDRSDFTLENQIGQSGTTIAPDLLINVGISGAVQYLVGIEQAKLIVSVNRDANAPIFAQSDYTYTGDAREFLNALKQKLEQ